MHFPPLLSVGILWVTGIALPAVQAATAAPPNIVFIFSDDHAYQAISAYGDPRKLIETPNLDRLANEGMKIERCLVPNSICGPSRATLLTGKYSHKNGFPNNSNSRFDGSQETFPKKLKQAGYTTALIGKWHLESDPTGFDHWQILPGQGVYYDPPMIRNGERVVEDGYVTDVITDRSLEWLDKQDKSKPFLLMMQHKAPHREWAPAIRHLDHDQGRVYPEPPTLFEDLSKRGKAVADQDMTLLHTFNDRDAKFVTPPQLSPEERAAWDAYYGPRNAAYKANPPKGDDLVRWRYQRYMHDYLGTIRSVDESVGRVLKYLEEHGLSENTIVVYASDQGFFLGEHGWFDKRWIFEESIRTPLLVRWPKQVPAGAVNRDLVSTVDFAQTFVEIAGAEPIQEAQGRSLLPVWKGATPKDWRKSFYYHYYEYPVPHRVRPHYGVVTDRYKLVHFYAPDVNDWELYDLKSDPHETQSVFGETAYLKIQEELGQELQRLRKELDVPSPDPEGYSGNRANAASKRKVLNQVALSLNLKKPVEQALKEASSLLKVELQLQGKGLKHVDESAHFDGASWIQIPKVSRLDPSQGPWSVRAEIRATAGEGVVLARGGESLGYALWLDAEGLPHFTVNNQEHRFEVIGKESVLNRWVTLDAVIGSDGQLQLFVDGVKQGVKKASQLLQDPSDSMQIGADTGSPVIPSSEAGPFRGRIRSVELYDGDRRKSLRQNRSPKPAAVPASTKRPNVVLIYADDLGYGDLASYGNTRHRTPNLDRLAKEGIQLNRFYTAQPVCSASRAALLTGCYPSRVGIQGALSPKAKIGLNPNEETLAELAKQAGYATAAVGKWHLGDHATTLPTQQGFEEYFGLPYSNDMWPHHPDSAKRKRKFPPLPLYENDRVIDEDVTAEDQATLTQRYTEKSVEFIRRHAQAEKPFFLYLAHSMPHVPLFVSEAQAGKSMHGLYADVIEEMDRSTGAILAELDAQGVLDETLVIFTSDNGPWLNYGSHAGSTAGLREGKGTIWEGGIRVPFLARWPQRFPQGVKVDQPMVNVDVLPTLAQFMGMALPVAKIDGRDFSSVLATPQPTTSEQPYFFYYQNNQLQAVMLGAWKLILPHQYRSMAGVVTSDDGKPVPYVQAKILEPELYDVVKDPSESQNLAQQHPDKVKQLLEHAEQARTALGDSLTQRVGSEIRHAKVVD